MSTDYTWRIDTALPAEETASLLQPYRPYRLEVSFSNGFSTSTFDDRTAYPTREPLAKLHYFSRKLAIGPDTRVLDVGSHLGHYGHYFLKAGAGAYTGIEIDRRTHDASVVLARIAMINPRLLRMDFGDIESSAAVAGLGQFDIVICLSVLNNIANWQVALRRLAERTSGCLVIEYAAVDEDRAVCEYTPAGHGPDRSHTWWFSELLMDRLLADYGLEKVETTLRWKNDAALGAGRLKIFSIYRSTDGGSRQQA
ncbi:class I SAM-dependent methyltransferase [Reyranella sp.]|uniref:class I SAM-dependent methyltransferase n=1 Tax=Reyranella sp. TaxID=1929291 RepID=UPI003BA909B2